MSSPLDVAGPAASRRIELDRCADLLRFAAASRRPEGGFGALDAAGALPPGHGIHSLQTARMTYVFSVGVLLGADGADDLAAHGVDALRRLLPDAGRGGVLDAQRGDTRKTAYLACFVALAAAAASAAGVPGADAALARAADELERRFWSAEHGAVIDSWDRDFRVPDAYWGANANMHAVETFLALGSHTGETAWFERAERVASRFIDRHARAHGWLLPEHYGADWRPRYDYNRDRPADEFRPFGVTIGHLFEWSRLVLELNTVAPRPWHADAARGLYATAARLGWDVDGRPGFVYTVDWGGVPVVRQRPHWVAMEAIAAAATHARAFGDARASADLAAWTAHANASFRDGVRGGWHHELDPENRPATSMWSGKPDAYHVLQALLIPVLPVAPGLPARLASSPLDRRDRGGKDHP